MFVHNVLKSKEANNSVFKDNTALAGLFIAIALILIMSFISFRFIGVIGIILSVVSVTVGYMIILQRTGVWSSVKDIKGLWDVRIDDYKKGYIYNYTNGQSVIYFKLLNGYQLQRYVKNNQDFIKFIFDTAISKNLVINQYITYEDVYSNDSLKKFTGNIGKIKDEKFAYKMRLLVNSILETTKNESTVLMNYFAISTYNPGNEDTLRQYIQEINSRFLGGEDLGFRELTVLDPDGVKEFSKDYYELGIIDASVSEMSKNVYATGVKIFEIIDKDGNTKVLNEYKPKVKPKVAKRKQPKKEDIKIEEEWIFEEVTEECE